MPPVLSKGTEPCPPEIKVGSSYYDFKEVEEAMVKLEDKQGVPFVVNGSRLVTSYNKRFGTAYPERIKYFRVKFTCKHYGPPRSSSKGIRPNQNTFKQYCPATVILQVSRRTGHLVVNKFISEHVHEHETEPGDLQNYPERRRKNMDPNLLTEVENLIELNVEPTRLLDYLENFKNKSLTAQDVANIKSKLKKTKKNGRTDSEEFFDELENLLQKDPGSKVVYGAEEIGGDSDSDEESSEECDDPESDRQKKKKMQLSYVYFHTSEMGATFDKFSDVLIADSTYCTNKYDMPLMVFLCLDAHGNGRVAGYCLMRDESKANVKNAVDAFCKAHPSAQANVKTILVDKDYNEREAFREYFPEAIIHICLFHTLQIFNRQSKGEPDITSVKIILEAIAYCPTEEGYKELYLKLQSVASKDFMIYYDDNWHNCLECWAMFHREMSINCGQTTTNMAESHNQKIKAILKKKRANMAELLRNLLLLHSSKTSRVAMKTFNGKVKIRYVTNNDDPVVQEISRSTTPFVGDLLKSQYNWAMEQASRRDALPAEFDYSTCTCRFYKSFHLPCSHMFLGRLRAGVEIFDRNTIPNRWQKENPSNDNVNVEDTNSVALYIENPLKSKKKVLSENQRFGIVTQSTTRLLQMVKSCGGKQFATRQAALEKIEKIWSRGKEIRVLEEGSEEFLYENIVIVDGSNENENVDHEADHNQNNNSSQRNQVDHEDLNSPTTEPTTGSQNRIVNSSVQYKHLDPKLRSTLKLPIGHVPKGRPKGKERKSAIGLKKQDREKQAAKEKESQPKATSQGSLSNTTSCIDKQCNCTPQAPVIRRRCLNKGPNHGRYFVACSKRAKGCNFFEWDVPICACGDKCQLRQTLKGEEYYGCWKHQCHIVFMVSEESVQSHQDPPEDVILISSDSESESYPPHPPIKVETSESEPFKLVQYDSTSDESIIVPDRRRTVNVTVRKRKPNPLSLSKTSPVKQRRLSGHISESSDASPIKSRPVNESTPRKYYVPKCSCKLVATRKSSYKNGGREYFECSRGRPNGCGYYRWADTLFNIAPRNEIDSSVVNSCNSVNNDQILNGSGEISPNLSSTGLPNSIECPCKFGSAPKPGAHSCFDCGIPVHAFGCSVARKGGIEGFGGSDRVCLKCAEKEGVADDAEADVAEAGQPLENRPIDEDPVVQELLANLQTLDEQENRGRPQRTRFLPPRLRNSYLMDETP